MSFKEASLKNASFNFTSKMQKSQKAPSIKSIYSHGAKIGRSIPISREKSPKQSKKINTKEKNFENPIDSSSYVPEELMDEVLGSIEKLRSDFSKTKNETEISLKYYQKVNEPSGSNDFYLKQAKSLQVNNLENSFEDNEVYHNSDERNEWKLSEDDNDIQVYHSEEPKNQTYNEDEGAINYINAKIEDDLTYKPQINHKEGSREHYYNTKLEEHNVISHKPFTSTNNSQREIQLKSTNNNSTAAAFNNNYYPNYSSYSDVNLSYYTGRNNEHLRGQGNKSHQLLIKGQIDSKDLRLNIVLKLLDMKKLIPYFEFKGLNFKDLLLLTKEDLIELEFDLVTRNRIRCFIDAYNKHCKLHTVEEVIKFFLRFKAFVFNFNCLNELISTIKQQENIHIQCNHPTEGNKESNYGSNTQTTNQHSPTKDLINFNQSQVISTIKKEHETTQKDEKEDEKNLEVSKMMNLNTEDEVDTFLRDLEDFKKSNQIISNKVNSILNQYSSSSIQPTKPVASQDSKGKGSSTQLKSMKKVKSTSKLTYK